VLLLIVFFYSSTILIHRLLISGYGINLANYSTISCRIISYINILSSFILPYLIVIASIDRYCASSRNAKIRKFSTIRVTKWVICIVIGVCALIFINLIVLYNLQSSRGYVCALEADTTYSQVYIITQVFLYAGIPPSLMMLFGLLTVRNTRRSRINPIVVSRYHRTEQQLTRMLIVQVSVHILLQGGKSETSYFTYFTVLHRTSLYFTVLHRYFTVLHRTSPYFTRTSLYFSHTSNTF
jgi:hypothetical protein